MSSNFCYIMPKNSLAKDIQIQKLVVKIMEKVTDIPFHTEYKNNMELLKMVCVMIEHAIDNKDKQHKIYKKDIVFQVYNRVFGSLNPQQIKDLEALHLKTINITLKLTSITKNVKTWLKKCADIEYNSSALNATSF